MHLASGDDTRKMNGAVLENLLRRRQELSRLVDRNDPRLTRIVIGGKFDEYTFDKNTSDDEDWEGFGVNIGKNTHLKEMMINLNRSTHVVENFFSGFVLNRSIEKLRLIGCGGMEYDYFPLLVPFFRNNQAFESLDVA